MKKSLYLFGGLIVLFVAFDLTNTAAALVGVVFDAMIHPVGEPVPESVLLVAHVALHMMIVAVGLALTCIGPLRHSEQHSMTSGGRTLHALAGFGVVAAALICLGAIYSVRTEFLRFSMADDATDFEPLRATLEATVESARATMRNGFMILGGAGGLLSLAAIVGLQRWPPHQDEEGRRPMRSRVQMATVLAALALASVMFLIVPHVAELRRLLTEVPELPNPLDFADELLGITNKSLVSFGLLGILGLLQIATAVVAPRLGDVEMYDEEASDEYASDGDPDDGDGEAKYGTSPEVETPNNETGD